MNSLKNISSASLITQTKSLCADERRITADVLLHLAEIESRRLYAELGYPSLFAFAVKELKYSEGAAGRRIAAMRMLRQVPELEADVRSGSLSVTVVSMAKHATTGQTIAEKAAVLQQLRDRSQKQAESTLAALFPESVRPIERERVLPDQSTQITFVADVVLAQKLEKIRGLLSHKNPNPSHQELLHLMADALLKRIDSERQTSSVTPVAESRTYSRYIPQVIRRQIWREYQGRCGFVAPQSGVRCESRHLLQIDHVLPFALGGRTEPANLRLLCRTHNLLSAERHGLR